MLARTERRWQVNISRGRPAVNVWEVSWPRSIETVALPSVSYFWWQTCPGIFRYLSPETQKVVQKEHCPLTTLTSASVQKIAKVKVSQSCPTLCDPKDHTVHGILQARILGWVAFPFPRGSSQPRNRIQVCCIAGGFFTSWATREAWKKQNLLLLSWYLNRKIYTLLHSFKYCVGQKVHWVFHKIVWKHQNEFLTNPIFKPLSGKLLP